MTEPTHRIITLTGRAPVRIATREWPVIASADDDDFGGDPGRHAQASLQGELDTYWLRVRRHEDGRAIVYGVIHRKVMSPSEDWRGGQLLAPGMSIPAAILAVGRDGEIPEHVIRECLAALPPEDLS